MSQQYPQRNNQQQQAKPQLQTPAPVAAPTPSEQAEDHQDTTHDVPEPSLGFSELSLEDQFRHVTSSGIADTITGLTTARSVQNDMRSWFANLSATEQASFKITVRDLAMHIARQVEDVMSEVPVIFM